MKGEANNFIAVVSSGQGVLGDDYYSQNYYSLDLYQKSLDENKLPIYRGYKCTKDDKIRRHIMNDVRTYFKINYDEIKNKFGIDFQNYFEKDLKHLSEHVKDGLVKISNKALSLTDTGSHFAPQIANVFDKFDPANSTYQERLEKIKEIQKIPS